jgi:hypothetical protein
LPKCFIFLCLQALKKKKEINFFLVRVEILGIFAGIIAKKEMGLQSSILLQQLNDTVPRFFRKRSL